MKTICLNMIVKNERDVIRRSLNSVRSWIDAWVIVDTGSSDGTQEIIRETLQDIPGELHERPWVDFAHNRNEALELSKGMGDYLLFIDADDQLLISEGMKKPQLDKDYYVIVQRSQEGIFTRNSERILFVNNKLDWKWVGAVHETLQSNQAASWERIEGIVDQYNQEGDRSRDQNKYRKDAAILERMVQQEPNNSRAVFYLAESYQGAKEPQLAALAYRKRAFMGGSDEEVFWSLFCACHLTTKDLKGFSESHLFRPSRIEPLYEVAGQFLQKRQFLLGYLVADYASKIGLSKDSVFVEHWMYEWGALLQCAECCLRLQKMEEAEAAISTLLSKKSLPDQYRTQLQALSSGCQPPPSAL